MLGKEKGSWASCLKTAIKCYRQIEETHKNKPGLTLDSQHE